MAMLMHPPAYIANKHVTLDHSRALIAFQSEPSTLFPGIEDVFQTVRYQLSESLLSPECIFLHLIMLFGQAGRQAYASTHVHASNIHTHTRKRTSLLACGSKISLHHRQKSESFPTDPLLWMRLLVQSFSVFTIAKTTSSVIFTITLLWGPIWSYGFTGGSRMLTTSLQQRKETLRGPLVPKIVNDHWCNPVIATRSNQACHCFHPTHVSPTRRVKLLLASSAAATSCGASPPGSAVPLTGFYFLAVY